MSGLEYTEAVEAAARALFGRTMHELGFSPGHEWDKGTPASRHDYVMRARTAVSAAAPLIEAQVREQVAAEIETCDPSATSMDFHYPPEDMFDAGLKCAARIARGDS